LRECLFDECKGVPVPRKDTARATISLRAPQPGEAVERAALELAAKMALGGRSRRSWQRS